MSEDFLSRWSRLKRGAPASAVTPDAQPEPDVLAAESAEAVTPEEIAALPAPESLLPGADLAPFLRRGVPAALRNAALRRMWAVDPEIRDFVGEARDYAWDWNVPGGVPVSGPLPAGFDVEGMVRRIFGGDREARAAPPQVAQPAPPPAAAWEPVPVAALQDDPPVREPTEAAPSPEPLSSVPRTDPAAPPFRRRRHGSALPT